MLLLQSPEHSSAVQEEKDSKTRRQSVKTHTPISDRTGREDVGRETASYRRKPSSDTSVSPLEATQVGSLSTHSLHFTNPHLSSNAISLAQTTTNVRRASCYALRQNMIISSAFILADLLLAFHKAIIMLVSTFVLLRTLKQRSAVIKIF